jgi:hypothetical protein
MVSTVKDEYILRISFWKYHMHSQNRWRWNLASEITLRIRAVVPYSVSLSLQQRPTSSIKFPWPLLIPNLHCKKIKGKCTLHASTFLSLISWKIISNMLGTWLNTWNTSSAIRRTRTTRPVYRSRNPLAIIQGEEGGERSGETHLRRPRRNRGPEEKRGRHGLFLSSVPSALRRTPWSRSANDAASWNARDKSAWLCQVGPKKIKGNP